MAEDLVNVTIDGIPLAVPKGTTVEVMAPGGAKAYEIAKVEWR